MESSKFDQGYVLQAMDADFDEGLKAAVDYRGDTAIKLRGDKTVEGFLFNACGGTLDYFTKESPLIQSVALADVVSISFSGQDEAKGRGWEDYQKRKQTKLSEL